MNGNLGAVQSHRLLRQGSHIAGVVLHPLVVNHVLNPVVDLGHQSHGLHLPNHTHGLQVGGLDPQVDPTQEANQDLIAGTLLVAGAEVAVEVEAVTAVVVVQGVTEVLLESLDLLLSLGGMVHQAS